MNAQSQAVSNPGLEGVVAAERGEIVQFMPTFAVGRVAGWTAHCFEQRALRRLIRPQSRYVGPLPD